ncbi:Uma2 family endonuclease [Leptolyngbya sp. PCC 6406]|uniref:Uma2 family endonuclease n=1 Tax=Leptolyngbya sp. PCC 6406 TaxID=1173264 RepID=UPI0002ABEEA9|nr:Uma2 family endonuclease [Leptolyngbya sp. PCC 6406]
MAESTVEITVTTEETVEIPVPDISHLVIEDDTPVDNFQSEKQQRLLVEPLYSGTVLPKPFIAAANVGLFHTARQEQIVPGVFLSLGVQMPADWSQKRNRTYFVWEMGKVPDVAIEIVSNRVGKELEEKKDRYARLRVSYYVVFDPIEQIQEAARMDGQRLRVFTLNGGQYIPLEPPYFLEHVALGLVLWEGMFEDQPGTWLRWCDSEGRLLPTGAERANQERQRAEALAARLRELGIDPDTVSP